MGSDGELKKPPIVTLRPIIPDNACILCITATTGIGLADVYSPDNKIPHYCLSLESGPCLSPSVADQPLGPATDHLLSKIFPHQLANLTRAPHRVDSSFCSSVYGVLPVVSNCCSPPKRRAYSKENPVLLGREYLNWLFAIQEFFIRAYSKENPVLLGREYLNWLFAVQEFFIRQFIPSIHSVLI
ncbi:hypothetical protein CQW23_19178 [Capsicum baccatum]|uniref:Uncharacterized protein n=1 Tax=Capsicum baccatum TaxID=33114 RepID=A0A2G2W540_CAPBA|nr:hypothetical protein CQW23_19178 [Capsicum baccatum]